MASSEDEGDAVPDTVSNYHFVNDKNEPVSLSELPVRWNDGKGLDGKRKQIFLHGDADNGLQKIYKPVVAWKFDLSDAEPQILVLSKDNNWIKLQKPRKSFENTIRTILITVHCLHFIKKNPELSGRSLWDHLSKLFRLYEIRPSVNDLIDHANIISEAAEKDETLAKSKFLVTFLEEKPRKKKALDEDLGTTTKFIVDDDMIDEFEESDGSDEEDDLFDSVCAFCDNGGDILCCEGRCMRSFHATVEAGSDTSCESLGLTNERVEAIQNFFCKNCQYKRHQCFSCGELGSSDKDSGAEVFPCVSATCGHFYHPRCAAKLLHRESPAEAEKLQKKIANGDSFTCPIHKCIVCNKGENKMDPDMQFAVCRRCPKSYHRKCLPRKIAFDDGEDDGIVQRAWENLIPNRILIYCLKHEIDEGLGTPIRNHIKFPDDGQNNKKQVLEKLQNKEGAVQRKRISDLADACRKSSLGKVQEGVDLPYIAEDGSSKKRVRRLTLPDSSKKQKVEDASVRSLNRSASAKVTKSIDENKVSLGDQLFNSYFGKGSVSFKSRKEDTPDSEPEQTPRDKPVAKERGISLPLDDASKQRILALVKDAGSSITLEKIIKNHKMPNSSRNVVDKSLTLGKVQASVEAISSALQYLEEGRGIEDAKSVCEPGLLNQIVKWKNKLGGYLAPFLNGSRYTSLGRHFTKVDKLKKIVNLLHCYVQDGDTMVDFCCGSNDFSLLMKEKLDNIGTRCSYKNYDLVQAKNNFNFEKRDWMTVKTDELPNGSKLIMGLNPPFGKNAKDANKFIDKALEFKPKLIILIAPPQTERLDKKNPPYDLIWEDDQMLAGKSFYLPGSVDVNDNQLDDWNSTTSLLNLWSRPDWTVEHKAIAQQHGHLSMLQERTSSNTQRETLVSDKAEDAHDLDDGIPMSIDDHPVQNDAREAPALESCKEGFPFDTKKREVCEYGNSSHGKNRSNEDSKKRMYVGKSKTQLEKLVSDKAEEAHDLDGETPMSIDVHPVQNDAREAPVLESPKEGFPFDNKKREVREHGSSSHGKNHSNEDSKKRTYVTNSESRHEKLVSDKAMEAHDLNGQTPMLMDDCPVQSDAREARVSGSHKEGFPFDNKREVLKHGNSSHGKNRLNEDSKRKTSVTNSESRHKMLVSDKAVEAHDRRVQNDAREARVLGSHKEGFSFDNEKREVREHSSSSHGRNRSSEDSKKRWRDRGNHGRESSETSPTFEEIGRSQEGGQSPLSETFDKLPRLSRLSPPIVSHGRSLEDGYRYGENLTGYGENRANRVDDIDRGYGLSREEHVLPGATRGWRSGTSPNPGRDLGYGVRNLVENEEHVAGGTRRWPISPGPSPSHGPDYGVGNLPEQYPGYHRDTTVDRGHRSYISEYGQNYATGLAYPSDGRIYGQQQHYHDTISGQRSGGYLGGGDPGFSSPFGNPNSAMGSSYNRMSTSAMERYTPQLNELNYARDPLAAVPPHHTAGRNGIPDPNAPPPGYRGDSMSFARDPYLFYSQHN